MTEVFYSQHLHTSLLLGLATVSWRVQLLMAFTATCLWMYLLPSSPFSLLLQYCYGTCTAKSAVSQLALMVYMHLGVQTHALGTLTPHYHHWGPSPLTTTTGNPHPSLPPLGTLTPHYHHWGPSPLTTTTGDPHPSLPPLGTLTPHYHHWGPSPLTTTTGAVFTHAHVIV